MNDYMVSVIVPVYNAREYITQCLDSLVNQTLSSLEIVLINDGSTDGTSDILEKYQKLYSNIVLINQENGGISKARTVGYLASHGKYIGWVDDDDFVETNMFEKLYRVAEDNCADYVYCDYDFFPAKIANKEKWYKPYKGIIDWNYIERNTHPWNKLVKRELCDKIQMAERLPIFSDSIYVGLLLHADKIVSIDDVLYHYRVGHASVSGSYKGRLPYYLEVSKRARKQSIFLEGTQYKNTLSEYFDYRYIYSLIQVCIVATVNSCKKEYINAQQELRALKYKRNKYTMEVLKRNYNFIVAFVMAYLIPSNYHISRVICTVIFH